MLKNALAAILGASFLAGCAATEPKAPLPDLPPLPISARSSVTESVTRQAPAVTIPGHVTLQWNCVIEGNEVTGIVSAPTPAGPWRTECQFPLTNTVNVWTDTNVTRPAKFYRAFNTWAQ